MNELIFLLSQNRYFNFKLRDRFYLLSVNSILIGRKDEVLKNSDWRANEKEVRPVPVLQVREVEEEHFAFDHERIVIPELY